MLRKGDELCYPKLTLSTDFLPETGVFYVQWIHNLQKQRKIDDQCEIRQKICACRQFHQKNATPTLNLFLSELIIALEDEYGDTAKGAWYFSTMFNAFIMQSLLTVYTLKG